MSLLLIAILCAGLLVSGVSCEALDASSAPGSGGIGFHNTLYTCGVCDMSPASLAAQPVIRALLVAARDTVARFDNESTFHMLDRVSMRAQPLELLSSVITSLRIAHVLAYSELPYLLELALAFPNVTFQAVYTERLALPNVPPNLQLGLTGVEMIGYLGGVVVGTVVAHRPIQESRIGVLLSRFDVSQMQTTHGVLEGARQTCPECVFDVRIAANTDAATSLRLANELADAGAVTVLGFGAALPALYNISERCYTFSMLANEVLNPLTFNNTNSSRSQRQLGGVTVNFLLGVMQSFQHLVVNFAGRPAPISELRSGYIRLESDAITYFPCVFSCAFVPRLREATALVGPILRSLARGTIHFRFNVVTGEVLLPPSLRAAAGFAAAPITDLWFPPTAFVAPRGAQVSGRLVVYDPLGAATTNRSGSALPISAPSPGMGGVRSPATLFVFTPELVAITATNTDRGATPPARSLAAIAANYGNDKLFLYGGRLGLTGAVLNDLWIGGFSCTSCGDFAWRSGDAVDGAATKSGGGGGGGGGAGVVDVYPTARFAAAMACANDSETMFIMGGMSSDLRPRSDLWKFNATTRRFTELPPDPAGPRAFHAMATYRRAIWWLEGYDDAVDSAGTSYGSSVQGLWYVLVLGGELPHSGSERATPRGMLSIFIPHRNEWATIPLEQPEHSMGGHAAGAHGTIRHTLPRTAGQWRKLAQAARMDFVAPATGCTLVIGDRVIHSSRMLNADGSRQRAIVSLEDRRWHPLPGSPPDDSNLEDGVDADDDRTDGEGSMQLPADSSEPEERASGAQRRDDGSDSGSGAPGGPLATLPEAEACAAFPDHLPSERDARPPNRMFVVTRGATGGGAAVQLFVHGVRNCAAAGNAAPSLAGSECEPCARGTFAWQNRCVRCDLMSATLGARGGGGDESYAVPPTCAPPTPRGIRGEDGYYALLLLLGLFVYLLVRWLRKRHKYRAIVSEELLTIEIAEATASMDLARIAELAALDHINELQRSLLEIAQLAQRYTQFMPYWLRFAQQADQSCSPASPGGLLPLDGASGTTPLRGSARSESESGGGGGGGNSRPPRAPGVDADSGCAAVYRLPGQETGPTHPISGGSGAASWELRQWQQRQRRTNSSSTISRSNRPVTNTSAAVSAPRSGSSSPQRPPSGGAGSKGAEPASEPFAESVSGGSLGSHTAAWRRVLHRQAVRQLTRQDVSIVLAENTTAHVHGYPSLDHVQSSASAFTEAAIRAAATFHGCVEGFIGDRVLLSFGGLIPCPHSELTAAQAAFSLAFDASLLAEKVAVAAAVAAGPALIGLIGRTTGRTSVLLGDVFADARALLQVAIVNGASLVMFVPTLRRAVRHRPMANASTTWRDSSERPDVTAAAPASATAAGAGGDVHRDDDEPPPLVSFDLGFGANRRGRGGGGGGEQAGGGHDAAAAAAGGGGGGGGASTATTSALATGMWALLGEAEEVVVRDGIFRLMGVTRSGRTTADLAHVVEVLSLQRLHQQLLRRVELARVRADLELREQSIQRFGAASNATATPGGGNQASGMRFRRVLFHSGAPTAAGTTATANAAATVATSSGNASPIRSLQHSIGAHSIDVDTEMSVLCSVTQSHNASGTRECSNGGAVPITRRPAAPSVYTQQRIRNAYSAFNRLYDRVNEGLVQREEAEEASTTAPGHELISVDGAGVHTLHPRHARDLARVLDDLDIPLLQQQVPIPRDLDI